jgi:hypothetical protein
MDEIISGLESMWRERIPEEVYKKWSGKLELGGYEIRPFGLISEKGKEDIIADIRISEKKTEFGKIRIVLAEERKKKKETEEIKENKAQLSGLRILFGKEIPYREYSKNCYN